MKFDYIVDYLCSTAGPAFDGAGASDEKINKMTEARMSMAFRRYVCGIDGDKGCDFFKMDEDEMLYIFNGQYYEMVESQKYEILTEIILETMCRMGVGIVYIANSAERIKDFCVN